MPCTRPSRAFHEIGAVHVEIAGDTALAHADAAVHARAVLDRVDVDVITYGRIFWRARRLDGRWRIAGMEMLYHKDTLAPVDPTRALDPASTARAERFRPSYRYLALVLHAMGREIDQHLPGTDRPDLVEAFLADQSTWLA